MSSFFYCFQSKQPKNQESSKFQPRSQNEQGWNFFLAVIRANSLSANRAAGMAVMDRRNFATPWAKDGIVNHLAHSVRNATQYEFSV